MGYNVSVLKCICRQKGESPSKRPHVEGVPNEYYDEIEFELRKNSETIRRIESFFSEIRDLSY